MSLIFAKRHFLTTSAAGVAAVVGAAQVATDVSGLKLGCQYDNWIEKAAKGNGDPNEESGTESGNKYGVGAEKMPRQGQDNLEQQWWQWGKYYCRAAAQRTGVTSAQEDPKLPPNGAEETTRTVSEQPIMKQRKKSTVPAHHVVEQQQPGTDEQLRERASLEWRQKEHEQQRKRIEAEQRYLQHIAAEMNELDRQGASRGNHYPQYGAGDAYP